MKIYRMFAPLVGAVLLVVSGLPASAQCSGTPSANTVCAGPPTGGAGQFRARALVGADLLIGSATQAWDADLDAIAGLTTAADKLQYWTGSHTAALIDFPSWARAVVSAANVGAGRSAFGLAIGADVQAYDAELAALAGLTSASGKVPYFTGAGTASLFDSTSYGRSVSNAADAAALRTIAGAVIGTNVQAWDADLDCIASNSTTGLLAYTGAGACSYRTLTAPAAGFTITNGAGTAGNPTFVLANDLAALEALSSTGIARRTGTDAWSVGTLVANAELANMATATFKGRTTAGTGAPEDLTVTQATALLNAMVGDSGSGGTKGLVPAPGAGDGAAAKFLKADGTWAVPAGGGGGSLSDTDRQNTLLDRGYQSKVYGLSGIGSYRRVVNSFADGFTTIAGVNVGASSNYRFDNIVGVVGPTLGAGTNVSTSGTAISSTASTGSAGQTADGTTSGANGWVSNETGAGVNGVSYVGQNFGSGNEKHIRQIVLYQGYNGDSSYSVSSALVQYSDNCSSWTTLSTITPTVTLSAQTFALAASGPHQCWRLLANSSAGAGNRWAMAELQMMESSGAANNMVLVTTTQTADASVSNARVLMEFDNAAAPTLNTDLTVDVTCNGGTNWSAASLSSVSVNGQGGRKIVETVDQSCTAGTSFAARVKNFNGKDVQIHVLTLTVH